MVKRSLGRRRSLKNRKQRGGVQPSIQDLIKKQDEAELSISLHLPYFIDTNGRIDDDFWDNGTDDDPMPPVDEDFEEEAGQQLRDNTFRINLDRFANNGDLRLYYIFTYSNPIKSQGIPISCVDIANYLVDLFINPVYPDDFKENEITGRVRPVNYNPTLGEYFLYWYNRARPVSFNIFREFFSWIYHNTRMREHVDRGYQVLPIQMNIEVMINNFNPALRHTYTYTIGSQNDSDNEIGDYLSVLLRRKMKRHKSLVDQSGDELRRQNNQIRQRRLVGTPRADDRIRFTKNKEALIRFATL